MLILSVILLIADTRFDAVGKLRHYAGYVVSPIHYLTSWPVSFGEWFSKKTVSRSDLLEENQKLKQQNLLYQRRAQKMAALAAENIRLRSLLNSSMVVEESVIVAEVIGVDPDPYRHEVILNRGSEDGVFEGQAVLDAQGLMGQVISVEPWASRVILLADSSHAVPVQTVRNGIRAIAMGSGFLDRLYLMHIPDTTDLREGDLLVSSGLGGRFPYGYPVAEITSIKHDPGLPFAEIIARPKSKLGRVRHVLLVFKEQEIEFEPENEVIPGEEVESDDQTSQQSRRQQRSAAEMNMVYRGVR